MSSLSSLSRTGARRYLSILVLAAAAASRLSAQQPRLADVARDEEQRRKTIAQPSKVYTNTDVKSDAASLPSTPVSPTLTTEPRTVPSIEAPNTLKQDEARDANRAIERSAAARRAFMEATGFPNGRLGWLIEHIIPIACGGADDATNMQWRTKTEAALRNGTQRAPCPSTTALVPSTQLLQPLIPTPIVLPPVLPPSCGQNTAREQAVSNYFQAAGFAGSTAPLPSCGSVTTN